MQNNNPFDLRCMNLSFKYLLTHFCIPRINFFVAEANSHVKTCSEQGSYANHQCHVTPVTMEFSLTASPVLTQRETSLANTTICRLVNLTDGKAARDTAV